MKCFKKLTFFFIGLSFLTPIFLTSDALAQSSPANEPTLAKLRLEKYESLIERGFENPDELLFLFYNDMIPTLALLYNDEKRLLSRIDVMRSSKKNALPSGEKLLFYDKGKRLVAIVEQDDGGDKYQKRLRDLDNKIENLESVYLEGKPLVYEPSSSDLSYGPRRLGSFSWKGNRLINYSFSLLFGGKMERLFSYEYAYNDLRRITEIKNSEGEGESYRLRRGIDENANKLEAYLGKTRQESIKKGVLDLADKYAESPQDHYYIESVPERRARPLFETAYGEGVRILSYPSVFSPLFVSIGLKSLFHIPVVKTTEKELKNVRYHFSYEYSNDKRLEGATFSKTSMRDKNNQNKLIKERYVVRSVSYHFVYQENDEGVLEKIDVYKKDLLHPSRKETWAEAWLLKYDSPDSVLSSNDERIQTILNARNASTKQTMKKLEPPPNAALPESEAPSSEAADDREGVVPTPETDSQTQERLEPSQAEPQSAEPTKSQEEIKPLDDAKEQLPPSSLPPDQANEVQEET